MAYIIVAGKSVRRLSDALLYLTPDKQWVEDKDEAHAILDIHAAERILRLEVRNNPGLQTHRWQVWIEQF